MPALGVISDLHDNSGAVRRALSTFRDDYGTKSVLVCGDITTPRIVRLLEGFDAYYVLGNCDLKNKEDVLEAIGDTGGVLLGDGISGEFEWNGRKIFASHGHKKDLLMDAVYADEYDLVCSGHTHRQFSERSGKRTLRVNPGSLGYNGDYAVVVDDAIEGLAAELLRDPSV